MPESKFVGVDGCTGGWFSIGFAQDGKYVSSQVSSSFEALLTHYADAELILVDIPIGLSEDQEPRLCDKEARKLLYKNGSKRGSSVFRAPTRQAARQAAKFPKDYKTASRMESEISGKNLTKQSFSIAPNIAEVDDALLQCPRSTQVREVHPEVCFWALDNGRPMKHNKDKKEGRKERIEVLRNVEPQTEAILHDACEKFFIEDVERDDMLDALAAAITAYGGSINKLKTLPENPDHDSKGLPMEMLYWQPAP